MQNAVTPFLMFEGQAEEAINLYVRTIPDSEILNVQRYGPDGPGPEGSVMLASISLRGQPVLLSDSYVSHDFTFTPVNFAIRRVPKRRGARRTQHGPRRGRQIPDAARQLRLQPPLRMGRGSLRRVLAVESAVGNRERVPPDSLKGDQLVIRVSSSSTSDFVPAVISIMNDVSSAEISMTCESSSYAIGLQWMNCLILLLAEHLEPFVLR